VIVCICGSVGRSRIQVLRQYRCVSWMIRDSEDEKKIDGEDLWLISKEMM
jgi:hypothetical protein